MVTLAATSVEPTLPATDGRSRTVDRPGTLAEQTLRVLLIEDNPPDLMRIRQMLSRVRDAHISTESVSTLAGGLDRLAHGSIDAVLVDLTLPDAKGVDVFSSLSCAAPNVPVIVLTNLTNEAEGVEAVQLGAQDYLLKAQASAEGLGRAIRCAVVRHQLLASLRGLTLTDEMTGLLNRRGFHTMANGHLRLASRTGSRFHLFFIDLDGLKRINDSWGHHEGDAAIARVAQVIRETFRQSDVLARYGGDEFAVLALDMSGDQGDAARRRLRTNLRFANECPAPYLLEVSIGSVSFDARGETPLSDLLALADRALYQEKALKRRDSALGSESGV